jgi:hypothetical protein
VLNPQTINQWLSFADAVFPPVTIPEHTVMLFIGAGLILLGGLRRRLRKP